jgi:hypothetical protein
LKIAAPIRKISAVDWPPIAKPMTTKRPVSVASSSVVRRPAAKLERDVVVISVNPFR